jgi:hypothetical protein
MLNGVDLGSWATRVTPSFIAPEGQGWGGQLDHKDGPLTAAALANHWMVSRIVVEAVTVGEVVSVPTMVTV